MSVDGVLVHNRLVRQQGDLLPFGQQFRDRAGLLQGLPDSAEPIPGRKQPDQTPRADSGQGVGSSPGSPIMRAALRGSSTKERSAASAAARRIKNGSSTLPRVESKTTSS